jgi:short-subunit dehydrogenase
MTTLILGATSDISIALARHLGSKGHNLQLAARNTEHMAMLKNDIEIRNKVSVAVLPFDALDFHSHESFYNNLTIKPDVVIAVFGYLGKHTAALGDWQECQKIVETNYTGAVSILNVIANDFEKRKHGTIVGISSVAGDRGRMSNYLYGSAKAGFTAYLSGLRNRLAHAGVHVMTVKPGFVDTKMTEGLNLPKALTASPEKIAKDIYNGIQKKKNTIYSLPVWRLVMFVIKSVPEFIFKKLKL